MERIYLYSDRRKMAEQGNLGPLVHDSVPPSLLGALEHYLARQPERHVASSFNTELAYQYGIHVGTKYSLKAALSKDPERLNDFLDLVLIFGSRSFDYTVRIPGASGIRLPKNDRRDAIPLPTIEADLNVMFDLHRYGFTARDGQIHRDDSPLLSVEIVSPALISSLDPAWREVDRQYREALKHQRQASERGDALTSANAAVEAALKALNFKGNSLPALLKQFRNSDLAAGMAPSILDDLYRLTSQLQAWRGRGGDAHPATPGADQPPSELVALAIHWAGALIVFLSERARTSAIPADPPAPV